MKKNETIQKSVFARPPVVAIVGHIDHGKTTLLDYIRKTNVVKTESGGITQNLGAFVVSHKDEKGVLKEIIFIDTPGHSAFTGMRQKGLKTADIAILVVSAEEGVKEQTKEAIKQIEESKTPFVVAITKIDKANANIEKIKISLAESNILVEGFGGNVPFVNVSGKTGEGIDHLLEMILLLAEMENLNAEQNNKSMGIVIEAHRDSKRGISATLVVKNGILKKNHFVATKGAFSGTRIMEDSFGKNTEEVLPSHPVQITGWNSLPQTGEIFETFETKKEAEDFSKETETKNYKKEIIQEGQFYIPLIIKTEVSGTLEALEKEIQKLNTEGVSFKIISAGVGQITEADIKLAMTDKNSLILCFRTKIEKSAQDLSLTQDIKINNFDIIYKLIEFLEEEKEKRRPRKLILEEKGKAKILKVFNKSKDKQVVGGKVTEGSLNVGEVKIIRRENEIGKAQIVGLEQAKIKTKEVQEGSECGIMINSKTEISPGDVIVSIMMVEK